MLLLKPTGRSFFVPSEEDELAGECRSLHDDTFSFISAENMFEGMNHDDDESLHTTTRPHHTCHRSKLNIVHDTE